MYTCFCLICVTNQPKHTPGPYVPDIPDKCNDVKAFLNEPMCSYIKCKIITIHCLFHVKNCYLVNAKFSTSSGQPFPWVGQLLSYSIVPDAPTLQDDSIPLAHL